MNNDQSYYYHPYATAQQNAAPPEMTSQTQQRPWQPSPHVNVPTQSWHASYEQAQAAPYVPPQFVPTTPYSQENYYVPGSNHSAERDTTDMLITNPIAQMGFQQASNFVQSVNHSYVSRWLGSLRYYFSVNNSFVLKKLGLLVFPFAHKNWSRIIVQPIDRDMYLPPSSDINAPDLYIPSMAFITYVLLATLFIGLSESGLKPEVLGMTASSGLCALIAEVLLVKAGFYLVSCPLVPILDILSYCGYKFVNIVIMLMVRRIHPALFYTLFLYLSICNAITVMKALKLTLPHDDDERHCTLRNYLILFVTVLQSVMSFLLCYMNRT